MSNIQLYNGDCIEIMDKLYQDGVKVDAIITDPPYGTTACKWDVVIPFNKMWKCIHNLSKEDTAVLLFGQEPFSSFLRTSNIKEYRYDWIWMKNKPSGFVNAKYKPMCNHELLSVFYQKLPTYNPIKEERDLKPQYKYFGERGGVEKIMVQKPLRYSKTGYCTGGGGTQNVKNNKQDYNTTQYTPLRYPTTVKKFDVIPNAKGHRLHPTQKPLELIEYLVKTYTNEGDTILDFTMGSGTTGVACKQLNRNFIGIELVKDYFDIAENRIKEI